MLYLKEPYSFVWAIVFKVFEDKYSITYPAKSFRAYLSQTTNIENASYISPEFEIANTPEEQYFPIDRNAPCVRFLHLVFQGAVQTNPITNENEMNLRHFYIEGIVLNNIAQLAMKARNQSRICYRMSKEALFMKIKD